MSMKISGGSPLNGMGGEDEGRKPTILRAKLISWGKMSNFTAVSGKNARFHGNFTEGYLLFFEPPKPFTCTDT